MSATPRPDPPLTTTLFRPYREHPGLLLALSAAVFVPLTAARYPLVEARIFAAALAITLVGHLLLAAVLHRFRAGLGLSVPVDRPIAVVAAVLLVLVGLEIVAGRLVELVAGREAFGVTLGGFLPSLVIGPLFALLVREAWAARRPSGHPGEIWTD